ncbi:unnamed protein product [Staurois parvus]|uniref:Uncharacterized protein n=1 Tax=Staurois parvus TaxID=386267 RepID=A0ABN9GHS9_9NEOB|nr:unnamed protein product [Staurois parvus]
MSSGRCWHMFSGFRSLRRQNVRGTELAGNLKILKNHIVKHYCIKAFHINFVPSALSCALPAFLLFFLPGN